MTTPVIHAENLRKRYGDVEAVRDVSFDVDPGEIFAVLGPNGAGKTTTIRMMLGLIKPDGGTATLFGQPVSQKLYDRLGYLPEERGLYQDVSALDGLIYLASLKGLSRREARERALAGLERMDLADKANDQIKSFSKGMQQKVQFLATILHRPDLIVIDEPFSGLDPINTQLIKEMLFDLARDGATIVMSTHQMQRIEEMADRLMMISAGRRVLYGPVAQVKKDYASGSVLVRAQGELSDLPGIDHIEARNGRYELYPAEHVTPQEVLAQLVADPAISVEEFEVTSPSLDEIFVQVATGDGRG